MMQLQAAGHLDRYALTAHGDSVLAAAAARTWVLQCGWEKAVAATKSVVEQALFYQSLLSRIARRDLAADLRGLPEKIETALALPLDPAIVRAVVRAPTVYFAGYNDGVAEELTLKTNEISRKKSAFLEGTYAVHGIEEVLSSEDVVIVIDPFEEEIAKFSQVLRDGVGLTLIAISSRPTPWPTILTPEAGEMNPYVFLAAGWNLLVAVGLALGVNLDETKRARKIGNEFAPR
jgi:glucosamine--fructose-6-phosphate aminotransferase (isomerizing)